MISVGRCNLYDETMNAENFEHYRQESIPTTTIGAIAATAITTVILDRVTEYLCGRRCAVKQKVERLECVVQTDVRDFWEESRVRERYTCLTTDQLEAEVRRRSIMPLPGQRQTKTSLSNTLMLHDVSKLLSEYV